MCLVGLIFIAIANGGIQASIVAFTGDQFVLPKQESEMTQFFLLIYFYRQVGILAAHIFDLFLCQSDHLMGLDGIKDCFPVIFGVLGVVNIIGGAIFVFGRPLYIVRPLSRNICCRSLHCIAVSSNF